MEADRGTYRFNDYEEPSDEWLWETQCEYFWRMDEECLLTDFLFSDLVEMVAAYNEALPERYSLYVAEDDGR